MKNSNISSDKISMAKNIAEALESGNTESLKCTGLSDDKVSKLMGVLKDEEAIKKILDSNDAKALLEKFGKE